MLFDLNIQFDYDKAVVKPEYFKDLKPYELKIIELWFSGNYKYYTEISDLVGQSSNMVANVLAKPEVEQFANTFRQAYFQGFMKMVPGAMKTLDSLSTGAMKEETKLRASLGILTAAGVDKPNRTDYTPGDERKKVSLQEIVSEIISGVEKEHKEESIKIAVAIDRTVN